MISTILLSGGVGSRSGKNIPKQYCKLKEKTIFCYCLEEIIKANLTKELVIVYGLGFLETIKNIVKPFKTEFKSIKYVLGGNTRQESVYNGLQVCTGNQVILHESARPLITSNDLLKIANFHSENVTMGIDIPFTVLQKNNGKITNILKRDELFNVQLPQKFNLEQLINAHELAIEEDRKFTDDSSLMFYYSNSVDVLDGSTENIKITNSKDFIIAEEILNKREEK